VQTLQTRVVELEGQVSTLSQQLDNALQGEEGEIQQTSAADTQSLENLRQELATAQQEVETLRANAGSTGGASGQVSGSQSSVAEQVAQEVAKLRKELEQQHELAKKQLEDERDRRVENMKSSLNKKLKEEREKVRESVRQELIQEHSAELQKLRDEHEAAMTKLREDHQAELERLTKEGGAAVQKAEGTSSEAKADPSADAEQEWPTEQQILELMKSNQRVKGIVNNNINKRVNAETEKLQKTIAAKDDEINQLKEAHSSATGDEERAELQKKIQAAEDDKKEAVRLAVEQESKKAKVQVNMLGMVQAKYAVVRKAAQETPEKPVKEVFEVADKTKPPPKPASAGAPPASPATAAPQPTTQSPAVSAKPSSELSAASQDLSEEEKIRQRQERFGTLPAGSTQQPSARPGSSFGQPSAPTSGIPAPGAGGTFGRPSQVPTTGAMGQPARRPSMTNNTGAPNPQAAAFTPGGDANKANVGTGPAALRGLAQGNNLPRPGGARAGSNQFQIQGAAQQTPTSAGRGGAQSGIPRGGGGGIPRGRGGGTQRGGANAGQKRPHEGGDAGDGKRMRGGGPGGS
jgi:nucleoprotein TPR